MKLTSSSTARRRAALARSRSGGSPQMPGPVMRALLRVPPSSAALLSGWHAGAGWRGPAGRCSVTGPRSDHPADQRRVIADDGVLDHVRQEEDHNEIERIHAGQPALAGKPEQHSQQRVDNHRPQDLLSQRYLLDEHVMLRAASVAYRSEPT